MKKILDIASYRFLPSQSGGQKAIGQFVAYLGKECALTIISVASNDASLATSYRLLPWLPDKKSRYADWSLVKRISDFVQSEKIETVIWEHPYYAWLAARVKKRTGVITVIRTHNIEYQRFRSLGKWWWPLLRRYERRAFRNADYILFITPEEKAFAIREWKIDPKKCIDLPFGIPLKEMPADRADQVRVIRERYGLAADTRILLFNGMLGYQPNLDALQVILDSINPLLQKSNIDYRIIICGKDLPASFNNLAAWRDKGIIYAGFVADIESYFKAADIFLNPVQSGGGVKTKMVEAIGYGATVVSTTTGAQGILREACGEKLIVVNDNDWTAFASAVIDLAQKAIPATPATYYQQYYWGNIVKVVTTLS